MSDEQAAAAARGVEYRVVYEAATVNTPTGMQVIRGSQELGEHARVLARLPMKLLIFDDDHAMIVLTRRSESVDAVSSDVLLVHRSPLLDALIEVFESVWQMSVPVTPAALDAPGDEGALLSMLASGLGDAAIARHLGVSERTVQRRIARLQQIHGVQSRFQLGIQVSRQGLLVDGRDTET